MSEFRLAGIDTMPLTTFPVIIDASCANHPLLPRAVRGALPQITGVGLTPKKMFGYAAMKLQDASRASVKDYITVRSRAEHMMGYLGDTLAFQANGISIQADAETKAAVSELVGIGVGLAAACKVFRINPNRITRYLGLGAGKRMDFVITVNNRSYLLEVRGTTGSGTQKAMIDAVEPKKLSEQSKGYDGLIGAVTLYSQGNGDDNVTIVDPPGDSPDATELDELATVLEYYHNVYRLTHNGTAFLDRIRHWLAAWRVHEASGFPEPPRAEQRPTHRMSLNVPGLGLLRGTMFDKRLLGSSIGRYESFGEATKAILDPTWFVGTMPALDEIAFSGDWRGLLAFSTEPREPEDDPDAFSVLESGVGIARMRLNADEEHAAANSFDVQRRAWVRAVELMRKQPT